jgi:hypothetical protein
MSMSTVGPLQRYTAIFVQNGTLPCERPTNVDRAVVLDWESAGVNIPWPEGLSAKEAIIQWAAGPAIKVLKVLADELRGYLPDDRNSEALGDAYDAIAKAEGSAV